MFIYSVEFVVGSKVNDLRWLEPYDAKVCAM
jgi:hypothetical protein